MPLHEPMTCTDEAAEAADGSWIRLRLDRASPHRASAQLCVGLAAAAAMALVPDMPPAGLMRRFGIGGKRRPPVANRRRPDAERVVPAESRLVFRGGGVSSR